MEKRGEQGFTLIELLIVVAIIGILAAIAIPNMIAAMQRAKQKRTMADMRAVAIAWEARAMEVKGFTSAGLTLPGSPVLTDIVTLAGMLEPTYLRNVPQRDGWGSAYEVMANASEYAIISYGRDATPDASRPGGATLKFDNDIVFQNGGFTQHPEGIQSQ